MEAVGKSVDIPQDQEFCMEEGRTSKGGGQVVKIEARL